MAVTDLTGTTWYFNESFSSSYGGFSGGFYYYINFTSNNTDFDHINYVYWVQGQNLRGSGGSAPPEPPVSYGEHYLEYWDTSDNNVVVCGAHGIYTNDIYWNNESYRTITITGGTDATNATLIAWLEANATQIVLSDPFTITYNNEEIYSTSQDGTVTLPCANKLMASDITVTGSDVYSVNINYNGSTITTASGTFTKTLPCAGKVMATDVTIAVVISSIIYTFENGELTVSNAPYEFSGGELTI